MITLQESEPLRAHKKGFRGCYLRENNEEKKQITRSRRPVQKHKLGRRRWNPKSAGDASNRNWGTTLQTRIKFRMRRQYRLATYNVVTDTRHEVDDTTAAENVGVESRSKLN
jgi:hypothetical protein